LKRDVDRIMDDCLTRQKLLIPGQTQAAVVAGVNASVHDIIAQEAPGGWGMLTAEQAEKVIGQSFMMVNREALAFWTNYRLELAGAVTDDVKVKIKNALTQSLLTGQNLYEVNRKLGNVILDPDKFRHAGGRIFPSAANRLQLITHTENVRAHAQGRQHFYREVGIKKVRWLATGVNTCKLCEGYDGQVFNLDEVPDRPVHPGCACDVVGEPSTI